MSHYIQNYSITIVKQHNSFGILTYLNPRDRDILKSSTKGFQSAKIFHCFILACLKLLKKFDLVQLSMNFIRKFQAEAHKTIMWHLMRERK